MIHKHNYTYLNSTYLKYSKYSRLENKLECATCTGKPGVQKT